MPPDLPNPLLYFPVSKNTFSFQAGLKAINEDEKIIQIDNEYNHYIQNKLANKNACFPKFVQRKKLSLKIEKNTCKFLITTLLKDWPEYFSKTISLNEINLMNNITMETLKFNSNYDFLSSTTNQYHDALDAILSQMQDDMSIITLDDDSDMINYLHLCAPNFWSAEEKIGKTFTTAHQSVPGMEKINKQHRSLNALLSSTGPFERFTWGLTSNKNLSQHPDDIDLVSRRLVDAKAIYLRIERQVTVPFKKYNAYLFFIRTYFRNIHSLEFGEKNRLIHSLNSMPDDIAKYKGISDHLPQLINKKNKQINK